MRKIKIRSDVPKHPAMVIENQLLLKAGVWKGVPLSGNEIKKAVEKNTNWTDKRNTSIFYGHDPKKTENWVGVYENRRYLTLSDGVEVEGFYADLKIYDSDLASKLAYGGAKFAVSQGMDYAWGKNGPFDIKFNHLGIVNDPGCKDDRLFLNLDSEEEMVEGQTYSGEMRMELNLEDEPEKEEISNNAKREDKNMTEDKVTTAPSFDKDGLKSLVKEVLTENAEQAKIEETKKAEAEASKKAEIEARVAEETAKIKAEQEAKAPEETKMIESTEKVKEIKEVKEEATKPKDNEADIAKLKELIREELKPAAPQTVAKPITGTQDNSIRPTQAEIAAKLVDGLTKI